MPLIMFTLTPQPTHCSTHFPYTTLFRSRAVHLERGVLGRGADEDDRPRLDVGEEGVLLGAVESMDLVDEEDRARDRKSTRLNSSHRTISYAVFCLNKKKNHTTDMAICVT